MKRNVTPNEPDPSSQSTAPDAISNRIRTRSASHTTLSPPGNSEIAKSLRRRESPKSSPHDAAQLSELKRSVLSRKRQEKKEVQEYWQQVRSKNSPIPQKQTQPKSPKATPDPIQKISKATESKRLSVPTTKQERKSSKSVDTTPPDETSAKRRKTVDVVDSSNEVPNTASPISDQQLQKTERITTRKQAMKQENHLVSTTPKGEKPHTRNLSHSLTPIDTQLADNSPQTNARSQFKQRTSVDKGSLLSSEHPQVQTQAPSQTDDQTKPKATPHETYVQQSLQPPIKQQTAVAQSSHQTPNQHGELKSIPDLPSPNPLKIHPFVRFPSQHHSPLFLKAPALLKSKYDTTQPSQSPLSPSISRPMTTPYNYSVLRQPDNIPTLFNSSPRSLSITSDRLLQDRPLTDSGTSHVIKQSRVTFQDLPPSSVDLVLSPPPPLTPFTGSWEPTLKTGSSETKESTEFIPLSTSLSSPHQPKGSSISSPSLMFLTSPPRRFDEMQKANPLDQLSATHVEYILQSLHLENSASPRAKPLTSPTSADSYYMRKKKYSRYLNLVSASGNLNPLSEPEFHLKAAALQGRLLGFQTSHGPSPRDGRPPVASNIFRLHDISEKRKYLSDFSGVESDRLVGLHWIPCIQSALPRTPKRIGSASSTTPSSSQKARSYIRKEKPEIQSISVAPISPPAITSSAFVVSAMISPVKLRPTEVEPRDDSGSDQDSHMSSVPTPKPVEKKQNIFWNDIEPFFKMIEAQDIESLVRKDEADLSSFYKVPNQGNLESEISRHGVNLHEFYARAEEFDAKSCVDSIPSKDIIKETEPIPPRDGEFDPLWIIQKMLSSFPVMEPMSPSEQEPCQSPDDDSHIVPKETSSSQNPASCEAQAQITKQNVIDVEPDEVLEELVIKQQKLREVLRSNNEMKAKLYARLSPMLGKFNFERHLWDAYERVEADYIRTQEILQRNTPRGPRKKRRFGRRYSSSASLETDFANSECISPSSSSNPADTRRSSID
eukprot:TRINITY_DN2706_c0_g1_i3.p1 TRINITY_DN2706_c0_g1~~TRINITY_DN2706_c0_g1_i3.p1  ORF type:complete len:1002 (+),score=153.49 TRINITY_DN2706_c0_g1_i3:441-3446(+)